MAKGLSGPQAAVVGGMVPRVVKGLSGMNLKGKGKAFGMGFDDEGGFDPVREPASSVVGRKASGD